MLRWLPRGRLFLVLLPALLAGFLFAGCEKPDASDTTSPSVRALLGTTTGVLAFAPPEAPPASVDPPSGWQFDLGNARFSELENGQASIQVVTQIQSRIGPALDLWLTGPSGTVFRWSGGSARAYDGVVCFQLRLEDMNSALPLVPGDTYRLTMAFRDPGDGTIVTAKSIAVVGRVHATTKGAPGPSSTVVHELLGCPRSVI